MTDKYEALRDLLSKATPGPWRWEFNQEYRLVHLVGGKKQYDLTIMDFTRWGMHGAGINLRDVAYDGMNLMHKLHERPDWIAPFPGRDHHKHWCAAVVHPDMQLMTNAVTALPSLLDDIDKLRDALETAKNVLAWYHDEYPETVNSCDHEAMQQIDAALSQHQGEKT